MSTTETTVNSTAMSIPILKGLGNYFEWRNAMIDWFNLVGCYDVALGYLPEPVDEAREPTPDVSSMRTTTTSGTESKPALGIGADQKRRELLDWRSKNQRAMGQIRRFVSTTYRLDLLDCTTAFEMWELLIEIHPLESAENKQEIRRELGTLFLTEEGDMKEHLEKFGGIAERGAAAGIPELKDDKSRCAAFIETLPYHLHPIRSQFFSLPENQQRFTSLRRIYLIKEKRKAISDTRSATAEAMALAVGGQPYRGNGRERGRRFGRGQQGGPQGGGRRQPNSRGDGERTKGKFPGKCFTCGKQGHKAEDCWSRKDGEKKGEANAAEKMVGVSREYEGLAGVAPALHVGQPAVGAATENGHALWILDSGATHHLTYDQSLLSDMTNLASPYRFGAADKDTVMTADQSGSFVTTINKRVPFTLKEVYYLPNGRLNLLSMPTLAKRGWKFNIEASRAGMTHIEHGVTVEFTHRGGLWTIELPRGRGAKGSHQGESTRGLVMAAMRGRTLKEWHEALGHLGVTTIKDLARDERVTGLTITGGLEFKTSDCESCQISKATRLTFNDVSIRGKTPLEIVHSDVAGPVRPSTSGMRYYVTIIDDFTQITLLRAMEKKSEVLGHLQKCIALLENALSTTIKVIRTDGGGEYSGERWDRWTQEKGLVHQITPAYTPQLNGVAERMNRTVKEMIAANLIGAKMGGEHWVFAMKWTEAMLMRTRVGSDGKTPWEVLWKRKPSMEDVHPFGCEAWVRIPEANREKGDMTQARAEKATEMGSTLT